MLNKRQYSTALPKNNSEKESVTLAKRRKYEGQKHIPIARAEDIQYTDPFDEDDWEAQSRMKAADIRAQKKK
jgi:hypothetical protein